jgi:hypothetical protein
MLQRYDAKTCHTRDGSTEVRVTEVRNLKSGADQSDGEFKMTKDRRQANFFFFFFFQLPWEAGIQISLLTGCLSPKMQGFRMISCMPGMW